MTVVEMLIAIFIFILILAGSAFLLSQIYKRYGFAMEQGISASQVQHSLKTMIEEIRRTSTSDSGSYGIQSADKFNFVFFADIDGDNVTERVHYWLQNGAIMEGVTKPSGIPPAYPTGDQTTTTIADHIVNAANQPLFYYFDVNYPADQTNNPIPVPVADVNIIRLVHVDIYYNLDLSRSPDNIRLESYVEMRNLKDNW